MSSDVIKPPREVSKELEDLNFKRLKILNFNNRKDDVITVVSKGKPNKQPLKKNKVSPGTKRAKTVEPKTQLESFQYSMKMLLVFGQWLGLNPVQGILESNISNIRVKILSWRFLHCFVVGIGQTIAVLLCLYRLLNNSISIAALGFFAFCASTCVTTFQFIQIGYRWSKLMKAIANCGLDDYIDIRTKNKCYILTVVIFTLGLIEHVLSLFHKIEHIVSCHPDGNLYEEYLQDQFPWYFDLNVSKNIPVGIILQILNLTSTMNWNYLDLYIICISIYLAGTLNKINAKIIAASEKHYLPSSHWRVLREDYTRATRLVRSFDDVISGLVFTSFASNLFFICLQVYNILVHGIDTQNPKHVCSRQSQGVLGGYEYSVYLVFSSVMLLTRAMTVSLVAASVNTASMVPAPALYSVPSSAFSDEVSRFITQVNEDKIALSGLQFFYVTRDMVLTVAGTIVTYELVLLQFSNDE